MKALAGCVANTLDSMDRAWPDAERFSRLQHDLTGFADPARRVSRVEVVLLLPLIERDDRGYLVIVRRDPVSWMIGAVPDGYRVILKQQRLFLGEGWQGGGDGRRIGDRFFQQRLYGRRSVVSGLP